MRSATQGEKAAIVQELRKEGHRLNDLLDAIGLSRSTYYYELGRTDKVEERNAELSSEITVIFNENRKRYGVRRVHHELLNRGFQVNHKRVQRIMNQLKLFGKRPKEKYHSYKGDVGKVADNIINRDFSTEKPLQKWTTDVSQFTLESALTAYPALEGTIIHSDRGTQYTSEAYRQTIRKYHIHQSMNSAGGRCHDNARCESMWARMKTELLYGRYDTKQMTVEELKVLIWRYFHSYWNNRRICSANGGLPPMIKRRKYYEDLELAA